MANSSRRFTGIPRLATQSSGAAGRGFSAASGVSTTRSRLTLRSTSWDWPGRGRGSRAGPGPCAVLCSGPGCPPVAGRRAARQAGLRAGAILVLSTMEDSARKSGGSTKQRQGPVPGAQGPPFGATPFPSERTVRPSVLRLQRWGRPWPGPSRRRSGSCVGIEAGGVASEEPWRRPDPLQARSRAHCATRMELRAGTHRRRRRG